MLYGIATQAPDFFAAFERMLAKLMRLVTLGQLTAASRSNDYVRGVLEEQGFDSDPDWVVDPVMFSGIASDGRPLPTLLQGPRATVARMLTEGAEREDALNRGQFELSRIVSTQVADAGRTADGVATVAYGASGYYRMLTPPSCSRCVVLAGQFYRYNVGFDRHPRCDCVHIPAAEADEDYRLNPKQYFATLTEAEQNKVFTESGAQAIRDGADIGQIVNARRGMRTASIGGRDVLTTVEGTTKRGWHSYVRRAIDPDTRFVKTSRSKYRRTQKPRLMPEQIYSLSREYGWDRSELMRQLVRNGYMTDVDAPGRYALERIGNFAA